VALSAAGLALVAWTVSLFFVVGRGTLAPWDPPQRLVLRGPYRYVRNPMITGVVVLVLGEAALWGAVPVAVWAGAVWLLNAIYIPAFEEPQLAARFGADYAAYCAHVPRWLPRRTPWALPEGEKSKQT
jgi:protein-S-isoprenylcysteine O-methyltransferase Ste14